MRSHATRLLLTVGSVVLLSFAGGLPASSPAAELPQADVPVAGRPPVGVDGILVAGTFKVDVQDDASSTAAVADQGLVNSPWPMFQHDLQHTGRSFYSGPQSPTLKWQFQVAGLPGSPAIGSDGTIYLPTGVPYDDITGYLYAVNPDGTLKWRFQFAGLPASTAPAIAADGTIYVHMNGDEGNIVAIEKLYAVNPDGTLKWIFLPNGIYGSFTSEVQSIQG
jgi:outer membrane protein assembly factor BamB